MPTYQYSAVNQTGTVVRGKIDAKNAQDLERRLGRLGLSIISGDEVKRLVAGGLFQRKISRDELAQFCFYVERLVSGGVPLLEGLSDVRDSVSNPTLRNTIGLLISDIEQGVTLSQAMKQYPKVFDEIFVALVEAGEQSGELDTVLRNIGENIRWQADIVKRMRKVFSYPIFALVVMMGATYGLMILVVPKMTTLLKTLGQELPPYTLALIATSEFLQEYLVQMIVVILLLIFALKMSTTVIPGLDYYFDKMKLRMPIVGPVVEKLLMSRFANIFGMIYASGISVIDGLKISKGSMGNKFMARGLDGVIHNITEGSTLTNAFRESGLFPPLVLRMIRLGETTGGVDQAMQQIKSYYDRDANEAIEAAQAAIGPIMMVFIAGLMVWVIVAVYSPLYDLISSIKV